MRSKPIRQMSAQKVVIIGHSYSSRLSLIRSVAEAGCEIIVIATSGIKARKKPIDCYSKYVSQMYYCSRGDIESLIGLLKTKCSDPNQKTIIIPDGDDVVAAIDTHKEELQEHFLFPHIVNEPCSCVFWMDKSNQKRLAVSEGLNVANGVVVDIQDGHYLIPEGIQYPCYCKPLATVNGGKGGMRKCESADELIASLDEIVCYKSPNIKVLVEDYKEIETEYALLGFSDGSQVIIPAILEFSAVSKQHKGIALKGKVVPTDGFEDLVSRFKQYVLAMGFVGVFDIDFYKSGGVFYFCEMNLRFGGSGYAITKLGVNLPAMLVDHFCGKAIKGMNAVIRESADYINERMCIDDWDAGCMSYADCKRLIETSTIRFVPDAQDRAPERAFQRMVIKKRCRKALKGVLKLIHS